MSEPLPTNLSDATLDALLARRYRDTSPEFEARWVSLKRELRQAPPPRRWPAWRLAGWLGAAAAVASVVLILSRPTEPAAPGLTPQMHELLTLDAALSRAQPLLDDETRAALLHLSPTRPGSH